MISCRPLLYSTVVLYDSLALKITKVKIGTQTVILKAYTELEQHF